MVSQVKLSNSKKREISQWLEQAVRALNEQRFDVCDRLCAKVEGVQPGNADVANLRAFVNVQHGNWTAAKELLEQAIKADPKRFEFHHNLAKLYMRHELYPEAAECYQNALRCNPNSPDIKLGYCASLIEIRRADEALPMLEQMLDQHPHHPTVLMFLAKALIRLKRFEEAKSYLDELLAQDERYVDARYENALLFMKQGKMDEAEAEFRKLLSLQPDHAKAYASLVIMGRATADDVQAMEKVHAKVSTNHLDKIDLCFAMAKFHESMEQFDKAFDFFEEGNTLRLKGSRYKLDTELAHLMAVMTFYTPEVMQRASDLEDDRLIFIVGMPRCGSTLTEQILASHPEVSSLGESYDLEGLFVEPRNQDKPLTLEELTAFSPDQWREVGLDYLEKVPQGTTSRRIVDKTLENFRLIGAIHCALPKARIVHVRRNPLDNCLAIYRTNFTNDQLDYGTNLTQLGHFYRMYQQVMQHWRDVLPEGVMYELDYEKLVANQEEETRKLLAACGLGWNEACLQFNKARTYVETASLTQVRRPIYTEAVGRWKHYEKHLQPLIRILGTG